MSKKNRFFSYATIFMCMVCLTSCQPQGGGDNQDSKKDSSSSSSTCTANGGCSGQ